MQKTIVTVSVTVLLTTLILVSVFMFIQNKQIVNKDVDIQKSVDEMVEEQENKFVKSEIVSDKQDDVDEEVEKEESKEFIEKVGYKEKSLVGNKEVNVSNWKTYKNKEHGFSFKYPAECKVSDGEDVSEEKTAVLDCHSSVHFDSGTIPRDANFLGMIYIYYKNDLNKYKYLKKQRESCEELGLTKGKSAYEVRRVIVGEKYSVEGGCHAMTDLSTMAIFDNKNEERRIDFIGDIQYGFSIEKYEEEHDISVNGYRITNKIYETLNFN